MGRLRIVALLICALFAVAAAPQRASAQDAETIQAAKDLMAVISPDTIRQMGQSMTNQIWPAIERDLRVKHPEISQATFMELRTELENIQVRYMTDVMADAPKIYAKYFTAAEFREMLAYHKTPTGQKALKLMPQVMTEVITTITPQIQNLQAQIIASFRDVLRKKGISL